MASPMALLIEDDCLKAMQAIGDRSIHLILSDLPYGTTQNGWDCLIPLDQLWIQFRRILAPDGVVILTSQGLFTGRLMLSAPDLFRYKLAWVKSKATNFLNAKRQPLRKHEDICVFYAKQPCYTPQMSQGTAYDKGVRKNQLTGAYGTFRPSRIQSSGTRYPTDVIYFKTAEAEGPVWHPAQKPVALGSYLIATYTDPSAVVLDCCFGSGSFLVAAATMGRSVIGIERNQGIQRFKENPVDLVAVAEERLAGLATVQVTRASQHRHLPQRLQAVVTQGVTESVRGTPVQRAVPVAVG